MSESEFEKDKDGNVILGSVKRITFGDKVIELGYEALPVLGKKAVIACYIEHLIIEEVNGWYQNRL